MIPDAEARRENEAAAMTRAMAEYPILPLHLQAAVLVARDGLIPTALSNEYTIANYARPE